MPGLLPTEKIGEQSAATYPIVSTGIRSRAESSIRNHRVCSVSSFPSYRGSRKEAKILVNRLQSLVSSLNFAIIQ